jgi:acetyl/propionyl-CoA carboxylase alpha subunit
MFRKVLVANRGEIALRVFRTLQELGIRTVAVYSEPDAQAPHVLAADEAVLIGPAAARESYLKISSLIEAARQTGAEAIHPGYGFMAENPEFARACTEAGLVFIGPSAEAMSRLGDKRTARAIARGLGIPTIPGVNECATLEEIQAAVRELGLPVLLKAAAGGGGKGIRHVQDGRELDEAMQAAQREALAAFADPTLIVEKLVHPARHVEVQLLADAYGNVVALGERECSLQRRYQKIIEESPSTAVGPELRATLHDAACRLARAAGYQSAGTVEFLLGPAGDFYFLEVNTRLQVEHPVTEWLTGLDLVRQQIEIAAGEPLSLKDEPITLRGHAIEARVYAEDPSRHFLPTTGQILKLSWPTRPGLRIDSGIAEHQEILTHYDPLLAKLIAWGPNREQARRRLVEALRETVLLGLVTNQTFLIELLESESFKTGQTFTHTVEAKTWHADTRDFIVPMLLAAALALQQEIAPTRGARSSRDGATREQGDPYSPWESLGRWRLFT